jgi:hypothetical protein
MREERGERRWVGDKWDMPDVGMVAQMPGRHASSQVYNKIDLGMGLSGIKKQIDVCLCVVLGHWFLLAVFVWVTTEVALTVAMEMTRRVVAALGKPFLHFFYLGYQSISVHNRFLPQIVLSP